MKFYNSAEKDVTNLVKVKEDHKKGWVTFGGGDKFPLDFIRSVNRSPVGTSVIETRQSFIKGGKLENKYSNLIVNSNGQTLEDIHDLLSYDIALFDGCYINVRYNTLGQITEIYHQSYEHTRSGITDDSGFISKYRYIPDLYNESVRKIDQSTFDFDVFNPEVVIEQSKDKEFYNGQIKCIRFMRPNSTGQRIYPIPILNSAISYLEIDYRMGNFHVNAIRNNFHKSHIFVVKGVSPNEKDPSGEFSTMREKIEDGINNMIGDDSAGGVFVQFIQNENDKIEILPLKSSDDDSKYTTLDNMVVSKISTASNVPPILANIKTAGSLGDSQEIENAVAVYNGKTEKYRSALEGFYNTIGKYASDQSGLKVLSEISIPLFNFTLNTNTVK